MELELTAQNIEQQSQVFQAWLDRLMDGALDKCLQIIVALAILFVGRKLLKVLEKVADRSMEKIGTEIFKISSSCSGLWPDYYHNAAGGGVSDCVSDYSAGLSRCGTEFGSSGKPFQLRRRCADSGDEALPGRGLHH